MPSCNFSTATRTIRPLCATSILFCNNNQSLATDLQHTLQRVKWSTFNYMCDVFKEAGTFIWKGSVRQSHHTCL